MAYINGNGTVFLANFTKYLPIDEAVKEIEDGGHITKIKEQNDGVGLSIWVGTQYEYNTLTEYVNNCIYIITDDNQMSKLVEQSNNTADFIVEQKVTDDWIYEKWNSGIAKCYGKVSWNGTITTATASNRYLGDSTFSKDLPEKLFISVPHIFVSPQFGERNFDVIRAQWSYASTTNTGNYRVVLDASQATKLDNSFVISVMAVGKWRA